MTVKRLFAFGLGVVVLVVLVIYAIGVLFNGTTPGPIGNPAL